MAHILELTDGSSTVNLAVATATGFKLTTFEPPRYPRRTTYAPAIPGGYGQSVVSSAVELAEAPIRGRIHGTSPNDVESQYTTLIFLLERGRLYAEQGIGNPVRLGFRRQGRTGATLYWVLVGIDEMPTAVGGPDWLDIGALNNELEVEFRIRVEPLAVTGTLTNSAIITPYRSPAAPTLAVVAGPSSLAAGTYYYACTFYDAVSGEETTIGAEASIAISAGQRIRVTTPSTPGLDGEPSPAANIYGRVSGSAKGQLNSVGGGQAWEDDGGGSPGAAAPTTNTTGWLNRPGKNWLTPAINNLHVDVPTRFLIQNRAGGNNWSTVYFALTAGQPATVDWGGTADADAYGGAAREVNASGAMASFSSAAINITADHRWPVRAIARLKVTAGVATRLQLRSRVTIASTGQDLPGDWISFPNVSAYYLIDLGTFRLRQLFDRVSQLASGTFNHAVDIKTSDGSSVTARLDYVEIVPYIGFVRLSGAAAGIDEYVVYEEINRTSIGDFYWPARTPTAYALTAPGVGKAILQRYGRIARVSPTQWGGFWAAAQSNSAHRITEHGQFRVDYVACFIGGLANI